MRARLHPQITKNGERDMWPGVVIPAKESCDRPFDRLRACPDERKGRSQALDIGVDGEGGGRMAYQYGSATENRDENISAPTLLLGNGRFIDVGGFLAELSYYRRHDPKKVPDPLNSPRTSFSL